MLSSCGLVAPIVISCICWWEKSRSLFCENIVKFKFQHLWQPQLLVEGDLLCPPEVGLLLLLLCSQPGNGNYDCDCDDFDPLILMMITAMMMIMTLPPSQHGRVRGCFDQARFVTSTRYGSCAMILQTTQS